MDWMTVAGAVVTVGTAVVTVQKILKNFKKAHEERNAQVLQAAKEELSVAKLKLEGRLEALETALEALKENVDKDLAHAKETHATELKNLSEKITQIREDLREQHSQVLQLLTALIDTRE
jgi:chromosome segregation ATPase